MRYRLFLLVFLRLLPYLGSERLVALTTAVTVFSKPKSEPMVSTHSPVFSSTDAGPTLDSWAAAMARLSRRSSVPNPATPLGGRQQNLPAAQRCRAERYHLTLARPFGLLEFSH